MPFVVRPAESTDLESVADILAEMDEFYGEEDRESIEVKIAHMRAFLFGSPPSAYLLVAVEESIAAAVGVATYSFLWPAVGTTRSLYLKELYVRQSRRRDGIGRLLMDNLAATATLFGCSRIEWTTDRSNAGAQDFYLSVGAERSDGKLFYRTALGA